MIDDAVEERPEIVTSYAPVDRRCALFGVGVDDREIELRFRGIEIDEEIEDLVQHLRRPRIGAIDLVDHHNRWKAARERLAEHEARLRKWAFGRVNQQNDAVDHRQRALHFAAEICVPGVSTMLIRRSL